MVIAPILYSKKKVVIVVITSFLSTLFFFESPSFADDFSEVDAVVAESNGDVLHLQEVTIEPDTTLTILRSRSIFIERLVAKDGARIRLANSISGANGAPSVNGGNGSSAKIFLGHLEGHVIIEARGGDGGSGARGTTGLPGRNGHRGRDAARLFFGLFYLGNGENGEAGKRGETGGDGSPGGDGGDGGAIAFYYKEKAQFADVVVDVSGGGPGEGGEGGLGGMGGKEGEGGDGIQRGHPGKPGPNGWSGSPGQPGRPGKPGSSSVYQLGPKLFQCLSRLEILNKNFPLQEKDFQQCRNVEEATPKPVNLQNTSTTAEAFHSWKDTSENILHFEADGRAGVDGRAGTRLPGTAGSNGGSVTVVVEELPARIEVSAHGGRGGNGADGAVDSNGTNGGAGGNGGHFRFVYIPKSAELFDPHWIRRIHCNVSSGEGGRGGGAGPASANEIALQKKSGAVRGRPGLDGDEGSIDFFTKGSWTEWIVDDFRAQILQLGK